MSPARVSKGQQRHGSLRETLQDCVNIQCHHRHRVLPLRATLEMVSPECHNTNKSPQDPLLHGKPESAPPGDTRAMKVDYCTQSEKPCGGLRRSAEDLQHCLNTSRAVSSTLVPIISSALAWFGYLPSLPYLPLRHWGCSLRSRRFVPLAVKNPTCFMRRRWI